MRARWTVRPLLSLASIALILVLVSGLLELTSSVRQAAGQARVEAELVTGAVRREIDRFVANGNSLAEIEESFPLREVFIDALALAPSILHVAVLDSNRVAVAHSNPRWAGTTPDHEPPIPDVGGLGSALGTLWDLRSQTQNYVEEASLFLADRPFATIHVVVSGTFLWAAVVDAASRGLVTAVIVIGVAIGLGIFLSSLAAGRIRRFEDTVAALREGKPAPPLPETGIGEFSQLARELNLLGQHFRAERQRNPGDPTRLDPSKALEHLGQTAAGVAHELRNQLQTVELELDSLRSARELSDDELEERVENAVHSMKSLGGAVRGFLKVARLRPVTPAHLEVDALLNDIADEMRPEAQMAGVDLATEIEPEARSAWADAEALGPAIRNLVRNSIQAFGGEAGRIVLRSDRTEGWIMISVTDDGPGMDPQTRDRVFDLYYTTRKDGSGVGLALARQSAELHGGEIEIESELGAGTTITLKLPFVDPSEEGTGAVSQITQEG